MATVQSRTMLERHRLRYIHDLLEHTDAGPMAEVGVYNGGTAKFLALACPQKTVYAFDTFGGMPARALDNERHLIERGFVPQSDTADWLAECPNVRICKGVFPESLPSEMPPFFSLVHLDGDLYQTTRDALEFFWPRLSGFIVIDDFGRGDTPGVERAVREIFPDWEGRLFAWHRWLNVLILQK